MKRVIGTNTPEDATLSSEGEEYSEADLLVLPPESDELEPWVAELERMMVSVGTLEPGAPEVGDSHALRAQIEAEPDDGWFEEWLLAEEPEADVEEMSSQVLMAPLIAGGFALVLLTSVVWPF